MAVRRASRSVIHASSGAGWRGSGGAVAAAPGTPRPWRWLRPQRRASAGGPSSPGRAPASACRGRPAWRPGRSGGAGGTKSGRSNRATSLVRSSAPTSSTRQSTTRPRLIVPPPPSWLTPYRALALGIASPIPPRRGTPIAPSQDVCALTKSPVITRSTVAAGVVGDDGGGARKGDGKEEALRIVEAQRVDADDAAVHVDERTAAVAVVNGGGVLDVGLVA